MASIVSGIADEFGESLMYKMDKVAFTEVVSRKVDQAKSLDS
jgi:hypothetical protein